MRCAIQKGFCKWISLVLRFGIMVNQPPKMNLDSFKLVSIFVSHHSTCMSVCESVCVYQRQTEKEKERDIFVCMYVVV